MSDALGIHMAQEADPESSSAHIWTATFSTFLTKLFVALTFALPLIFLPLGVAVIVSVGWGLIVIVLLSYYLANAQKVPVIPVVVEHLAIAVVVVILAHFIGVWVQSVFS